MSAGGVAGSHESCDWVSSQFRDHGNHRLTMCPIRAIIINKGLEKLR